MYSSIRANFAESEGVSIEESILDSKSKDLTRNKNKVDDKTLEAVKKEQDRLAKEKAQARKKKEKMKNPWNRVMSRWAVLAPQKISNADAEKGKAFNRSEQGDAQYSFLYKEGKSLDISAQAAAASAAAASRLKFENEMKKSSRYRRTTRRKSDASEAITDPELLRLKMEEANKKLYAPKPPSSPTAARRGTVRFLGEDVGGASFAAWGSGGETNEEANEADSALSQSLRQQNELRKSAQKGVRALRIASKALAAMAARADFNFQTRIRLFPHHRIDLFFDSNDTAAATSSLRPIVSQWVLDIHRVLDRPFFLWLSDWKVAESKLFCLDGKMSYLEQVEIQQRRTSRSASVASSGSASSSSSSFAVVDRASHSQPLLEMASDQTVSNAQAAREVSEQSFMQSSVDFSKLQSKNNKKSKNKSTKTATSQQQQQQLQQQQQRRQLEERIKQQQRENKHRSSFGLYSSDRLPIHHPDRELTDNTPERLPKLSQLSHDNFFYPHNVSAVDPQMCRHFAFLRPSTQHFSDELQLGEQRTHLCCPTIQHVMQTTWLSSEIQRSEANQKLLDVVFSKHERTLGRIVTRVFFAALDGDRCLLLGLEQFKNFAKKAKVGIDDVEPWRQYGITKEDDNLEELVKRATSGDHQALKEVRAAVATASSQQREKEQGEFRKKRTASKQDLMSKNQPSYVIEMKERELKEQREAKFTIHDHHPHQDQQSAGSNSTSAAERGRLGQEEGNSGVLALLPILYHQLSKPYNGLSIASFTLALFFLSEMLYRPPEISQKKDGDDDTHENVVDKIHDDRAQQRPGETFFVTQQKQDDEKRQEKSSSSKSQPAKPKGDSGKADQLEGRVSSFLGNKKISFMSSLVALPTASPDAASWTTPLSSDPVSPTTGGKLKKSVTFVASSTTSERLKKKDSRSLSPSCSILSCDSENSNQESSRDVFLVSDHEQSDWVSLMANSRNNNSNNNNNNSNTNRVQNASRNASSAIPSDRDELADFFDSRNNHQSLSGIRQEESPSESLAGSSSDDENDEGESEENEAVENDETPLRYAEGTTDHEILCDTFVTFIRNHLVPFLDTCFPWYADPDVSVVTTVPAVHNIVHREFRGMLKQLFSLSSQTPTAVDKSKYSDLKKKAQELQQRNSDASSTSNNNNNSNNKNNAAKSTRGDFGSVSGSPSSCHRSPAGSATHSSPVDGGINNSPFLQRQHQNILSAASDVLPSLSAAAARFSPNGIMIDDDALRSEDQPDEAHPEVHDNVMSGVVLSRMLQSIAHFTHISQRDEKIVECAEQMIWAVSLQHADHAGKTKMRDQWTQGHQCSPIALWENAAVRFRQVDAGVINRSESSVSLVDYFRKNSKEAKETKPAAIADYVEPLDCVVVSYNGFLEALARMAIIAEIGRENTLRFPKLEQIETAVVQFFRRKVLLVCRDIFTSRLTPRDEMRSAPDYEKREGACVIRSVRLVARSNLLKEGPCSVHFHQVDSEGSLQVCFHRALCVWAKPAAGERASSFVLPPLKQVLRAINWSVQAGAKPLPTTTTPRHHRGERRGRGCDDAASPAVLYQPTPHIVNFRVTGRLISQSSLAVRISFVHIFEIAFGSFGKKWTAVPAHNVHETSETNPPFSFVTPTSMFQREETAIFVRARDLILASPAASNAARSILRLARTMVISARRCVSILLEASLLGEATREHVRELMDQDELGFSLAQLLLGWTLCEVRKDSPLLAENNDDNDEITESDDENDNTGRECCTSSAVTTEKKLRAIDAAVSSREGNIDFSKEDFNPSRSLARRLRRHSLSAETFASPKQKSSLVTATEALDMLVGGDAAKSNQWLSLMRNSRCQVQPAMSDNTDEWLDEMSALRIERAQSIEEFAAEFLQDVLFCDAAWVARHEKKVAHFIEKARTGEAAVSILGASSFLVRDATSSTKSSSSFAQATTPAFTTTKKSSNNNNNNNNNNNSNTNTQFSEHLLHHSLFTAPSRQVILFAAQILKSASSAYRVVKRSATRPFSASVLRRKLNAGVEDSPLSVSMPSVPSQNQKIIPRPPVPPTTSPGSRRSCSIHTNVNKNDSPSQSSLLPPPLSLAQVAKEISDQKHLGVRDKRTYFDRSLIFSMLSTAATTEQPGWCYFLVSRSRLIGSIGFGDESCDAMFYRQARDPSAFGDRRQQKPRKTRSSSFSRDAALIQYVQATERIGSVQELIRSTDSMSGAAFGDSYDDGSSSTNLQNNTDNNNAGHIILVDNTSAFPKPWNDLSPFVSRTRPVGFYSVHGARFPFVWTRPYCPGGDLEVRQILDVAARRISSSVSADRYSMLLADFVKTSIRDRKDIQLVGSSSFHNLVPFSRTSSLLRDAHDHLASSAVDHLQHPNTCRVYKIFLEDKLKSCFVPSVLFGCIVETNPSGTRKPFSGPFSTLSFQIPHFHASNFAVTLYSAVPVGEVIGWYREYVLDVKRLEEHAASSSAASAAASTCSSSCATGDYTTFGPFTVQDAYQPGIVACALHLFREHSRDSDSSDLRKEMERRGFIIQPQIV